MLFAILLRSAIALLYLSAEARRIQQVLVLDVDGTLYDDDCLIEAQIRNNCYKFAHQFGYDSDEADELHKRLGSTIRGLCENGASKDAFLDYYNEAYAGLDMSLLRKYSSTSSQSTGYSVDVGFALKTLRKFRCPIVIASNSPVYHVKRVLSRLGLVDVKIAAYLTPERLGGITKCEQRFWYPLFKLFPRSQFQCTLVDDNSLNVETVRSLGMQAIQVTPKFSLAEALIYFLDILPLKSGKRCAKDLRSELDEWKRENNRGTTKDSKWLNFDAFKFDGSSYLHAKNMIDQKSLNREAKSLLLDEIVCHLQSRPSFVSSSALMQSMERDVHQYPSAGPAPDIIRYASDNSKTNTAASSRSPDSMHISAQRHMSVVDLGAGLLNMLSPVLDLYSEAVVLVDDAAADELEILANKIEAAKEQLRASNAVKDFGNKTNSTNSSSENDGANKFSLSFKFGFGFGQQKEQNKNKQSSFRRPEAHAATSISYIAFESNTDLLLETVERLSSLGLREVYVDTVWLRAYAAASAALTEQEQGLTEQGQGREESTTGIPESHIGYHEFLHQLRSRVRTYRGECVRGGVRMDVTVHLVSLDFMSEAALLLLRVLAGAGVDRQVDLIVGCCVADLLPPDQLAGQLVEIAGDGGGVLYLPITFAGGTRIVRVNSDSSGESSGTGGGSGTGSSRSCVSFEDDCVDSVSQRTHCGYNFGASDPVSDSSTERLLSANQAGWIVGSAPTSLRPTEIITSNSAAVSSQANATVRDPQALREQEVARLKAQRELEQAERQRADRARRQQKLLRQRQREKEFDHGDEFWALPVPSNEEVFNLYHEHLTELGHHIDSRKLQESLSRHGCQVLENCMGDNCTTASRMTTTITEHQNLNGKKQQYQTSRINLTSSEAMREWRCFRSDWKISLRNQPYMWRCMLRFLSLGTTFRSFDQLDIRSWFYRLQDETDDVLARPTALRPKPKRIVYKRTSDNVTSILKARKRHSARSPIASVTWGKYDGEQDNDHKGEDEYAPDLIIQVRNIDIVARLPKVVQRVTKRVERARKTGWSPSSLFPSSLFRFFSLPFRENNRPRGDEESSSRSMLTSEFGVCSLDELKRSPPYYERPILGSLKTGFGVEGPEQGGGLRDIIGDGDMEGTQGRRVGSNKADSLSPRLTQEAAQEAVAVVEKQQEEEAHSFLDQLRGSPFVHWVLGLSGGRPGSSTQPQLESNSTANPKPAAAVSNSSVSRSTSTSVPGSTSARASAGGWLSSLRGGSSTDKDDTDAVASDAQTSESKSKKRKSLIFDCKEKCLMLEFTAPREVRVVAEAMPTPGAKQLLLQTICSLVSTGTELKVFAGDMDSSQEADLTISDMKGKGLSYPLRYGYSLVGEVVSVGRELELGDWKGRRFFSFSPHGTAAVIDAESAMEVPDDISAEDAIFLPSMETAVSLAMQAKPLLGEKIGVVGQGLIGLLTAAALRELRQQLWLMDVRDDRLAIAAEFVPGAYVWNPLTKRSSISPQNHRESHNISTQSCHTAAAQPPELDICVEVSGSMRGLQTAVDSMRTGGRLVLGSWYGESACPLRLGMKFHRSQIQLVCSQVSHIPAEFSSRWTKTRRFALTWDLIRAVRPSRLLSLQGGNSSCQLSGASSGTVKLAEGSMEVQNAYEGLSRGDLVTVMFHSH